MLSGLTELRMADCARPGAHGPLPRPVGEAPGGGLREQQQQQQHQQQPDRPFTALAASLPHLARLALSGTSAMLEGVDLAGGLARLRALRELVVEAPAVVPHQVVLAQDLDLVLPSLVSLAPTLRSLVFRRPGWTHDRLRALAPLSALTRLELGEGAPGAWGGGGGRSGGGGLPVGAAGGAAGGGRSGGSAALSADAGLQLAASQFPALRVLWLGPPPSDAVTDDGVGALAGGLAGLQRLELQGCSRLTNPRLAQSLPRLAALRHLDLSNCLNLQDSSLAVCTALSALTCLKLRGCWKVTGDGLGVLRPPLLQLRHLDLSDCRVTDEGLQQVAELSALTCLQLTRSWYVRAPGLAALSRLGRLAVLDLGSTNTDNTGVEQMVPGLGSSLTDLDLSATLINARGVATLGAALPRLRRLRLNKCPGLDDDGLSSLSSLSCLRHLHTRHCRGISDGAAAALAAKLAPRLQHWQLDGCWGVAMGTIDRLYGRPGGEWRRAGDVCREAAAAAWEEGAAVWR